MDQSVVEIEFQHSPIPDGTFRRNDEVTIKRDGCVWRIHRNDPDPFPSQPHAHNVESGLKLDLSNGRLYFGRKFAGRSISSKDLEFIRSEAANRDIILPPLVASILEKLAPASGG